MKKLIYATLCIFFLSGCSATSVYTLPESEKEGLIQQTYQHPKQDVFTACTQKLSSEGWVLANSDRSSGVITTEWRQNADMASKIMVGNMRIKVSILVIELAESSAQAKVTMQVQTQGAYGTWEQHTITKSYAEREIKPFLEAIYQNLNSG